MRCGLLRNGEAPAGLITRRRANLTLDIVGACAEGAQVKRRAARAMMIRRARADGPYTRIVAPHWPLSI
jgi:hypothetical protein